MTDLTKIREPFGLLDKETQEALEAHGGPYEIYTSYGWSDIHGVGLYGHHVYRVAPQPFDWAPIWALVKKEYRWLARTEDGVWLCFEEKPERTGWNGWWAEQSCYLTPLNLPTDIPWEDSLMERPE